MKAFKGGEHAGAVSLRRAQAGLGRARVLSAIRVQDNLSGIYSARFSPDGKVIAVTCGSGGIQLRDAETGELRETLRGSLEQALPVLSARFAPRPQSDQNKNNRNKAAGQGIAGIQDMATKYSDSDSDEDDDDDGTALFMPTRGSTDKGESKKAEENKGGKLGEKLLKFKMRSSGVFYAGSACGRIFKCNLKEGVCESFAKEEGNEVHAVDLDAISSTLVSGGKDSTVRLYDTLTKKLVHAYEKATPDSSEGHSARIFCVRCDPVERSVIYTGGWDDIVKVWDTRKPKGVTQNLYGPHICGSDAIDVQGDMLLTGSWAVRDSIKVWDTRVLKVLNHVSPTNRKAKLDGEFLYAAQFFKGDPSFDLILAGGSGTGAVEVISRSLNKIVAQLRAEKPTFTIDSYGPVFAFGGTSNKFTIAEYT
ncbi:uncharacterized protein LOC124153961 isoform X2 [Ischnura elegans]|uniref:uncharacterized protein LOC124153961 isoform X2 n=1 Tax=Ischnura elegans TaxID=197161 RepID=UPI001ED870EF|nr:uncharacterized protein LOC124153961 isoform X2 [Ischnura elegans]